MSSTGLTFPELGRCRKRVGGLGEGTAPSRSFFAASTHTLELYIIPRATGTVREAFCNGSARVFGDG